jgi:hypothetical protein
MPSSLFNLSSHIQGKSGCALIFHPLITQERPSILSLKCLSRLRHKLVHQFHCLKIVRKAKIPDYSGTVRAKTAVINNLSWINCTRRVGGRLRNFICCSSCQSWRSVTGATINQRENRMLFKSQPLTSLSPNMYCLL